MTPYIKQLIATRQRFLKLDNEYKKQAKIVEHHIKLQKRKYHDKFQNKDSKIWWKIVNKAKGTACKQQNINYSPEELVNGFYTT